MIYDIPPQDAHNHEVSALCFSGDGNYMATGSADKVVKVWSWTHGKRTPSLIHTELLFQMLLA